MKSKTIKKTYTFCKFNHNIHKLRTSLENRQHRKHLLIDRIRDDKNIFLKDKNLIRNKLKKPIPLLQFSDKIKKDNSQKSKKYSKTQKKLFSDNKKDFIT